MIDDTEKRKLTIAIIGGGFAGTMLAVHFLQQNTRSLHLIIINSRYPLNKGIAYSSYSNKHLLNVRARNMSAYEDSPRHFTDWIRNHDKYAALDQNELPDMFLPRNIYGYYLKDVFDNAIRKKSQNVTFEFVHDEAIDLEITGKSAQVYFSVSPPITADKVILAMGNQDPRDPNFKNGSFINSKRYFPNPWLNESVSHVEHLNEVLIIGNGLTMVDVVLGLREKNFRGKIYSLSPHGFKILPHRKFEAYHHLILDLQPPYDLEKMVKAFRIHVRKLKDQGVTGEAVVDSLRPLTQKIWMQLKKTEKERFLYHLRHIWGVARHRLPKEIHQVIQQSILDDTLEIIAGRIESVHENEVGAHFKIRKRNKGELLELKVDRVINCTGPESDLTRMKSEMIQNLVTRKLIFPDELSLGINAAPDGTIIQEDGSLSTNLYTIGTWLKGILWETTAVPEIRAQATQLVSKLVRE